MRAPALALLSLVALAALCAAGSARAAPARVGISIDCPRLDDDGRAALEARARADLVLERVSEGTVFIACRESTARIAWRPSTGDSRDATVSLPADRPGSVDALLQVVHSVLVDVVASTPGPSLDPEVAPPPAPPPPSPPPPPELATPSAIPSDGSAGTSTPVERETPPRRTSSRWRALAGARSELWSGAIAGAVGAQAGVRVGLPGPWRLAVLAGPSWGTTSASGIHAWSLWAAARVELVPWNHLVLSVGGEARLLWAGSTPQTFTQSQLEGTTGGAVLGAGYRTVLGPLDLSVGPSLEGLVRPVIVQVNGQEAFRLPTFVASLSLEASTL